MTTPAHHQLPVELHSICIRELSTVELHAMTLVNTMGAYDNLLR